MAAGIPHRVWQRFAAAAAMLLAQPAFGAGAEPVTFQGGLFQGLRGERAADGDFHFLPGVAEPKPGSPSQASAIESLITG